jgi:ketosteroid isomerase-like protein
VRRLPPATSAPGRRAHSAAANGDLWPAITTDTLPQAEIKRRAESDKQLQSHFEGELKMLSDRLTLQMGELQSAVKSSLDGLSRSLADLHIVIKEEREQRRWGRLAAADAGHHHDGWRIALDTGALG